MVTVRVSLVGLLQESVTSQRQRQMVGTQLLAIEKSRVVDGADEVPGYDQDNLRHRKEAFAYFFAFSFVVQHVHVSFDAFENVGVLAAERGIPDAFNGATLRLASFLVGDLDSAVRFVRRPTGFRVNFNRAFEDPLLCRVLGVRAHPFGEVPGEYFSSGLILKFEDIRTCVADVVPFVLNAAVLDEEWNGPRTSL